MRESLNAIRPPATMSEDEQWEVAVALMEQYGDYVGNYLLGSIRVAMEDEDHEMLGNMFAIGDKIDELNGGETVVQRHLPQDLKFSH